MQKEQRPHTLEKTLEEQLETVKRVGEELLCAPGNEQAKRKRAELLADLDAVVNKYSNMQYWLS